MAPVLILLRPSSEVTDDLSKLAPYLFQGWGLIELPLRVAFSPTHWHARRPISPGEGLLFPSLHDHTFSPNGVVGLSFTARIGRHRSSIFFSLEGGLEGLPLRVSNEGLPRPRVARAQETI
jgi:hypothetical protein